MKFLTNNPAPWATNPTFPAGSFPWSGGATRVFPGSGFLAAGTAPNQQFAAQVANYQFGTIGDALSSQAQLAAHAALRQWTAVTIPQVGTDSYADIVGQRLSRGYGVNTDTQRQVYTIGTDSSGSPANLARVAKSSDGSQFDPATLRLTTISAFTSPTSGYAGAANELVLLNGGSKFAYSTNDASTWTLSATYSGTPNIQRVHYVPGTGAAAGYYALTSASSNNCARAASLAALDGSPSFSSIGVGAFGFSTTQGFADNGSVILVSGVIGGAASVYRSTNGGASWAQVLTYSGTNSAIVWSDFWQLFIAIDDSGHLATSPDGATWSVVRSGLTSGFSISARSMVSCGPAIAVTSSSGNNLGIVYSIDLGATWNYFYMGYGTLGPTALKSLNGRVYALGNKTIWASGVFGAPTAEI